MKQLLLIFLCIILILPSVFAGEMLAKQCPSCGWKINSDDETYDFSRLNFCKNCGTKLVDAPAEIANAAAIPVPPYEQTQIGDIIISGHYEQDGNWDNGQEEIEWIVLDKKDDQILVISRYGLDSQRFHMNYSTITWETCILRQWLNYDFFNAAFTIEEQSQIHTTIVSGRDNPYYNPNPGNDTQDKMFLLSLEEAKHYFSSDDDRKCTATIYAQEQGARTLYNYGGFCWWLRSARYSSAAIVDFHGSIDENGKDIYGTNIAIRPAMWISPKNVVFAKSAPTLSDEEDSYRSAAGGSLQTIYAQRGDIITFGHYEQDNDFNNGKEKIEWIVLDKKDDRILVVSKYALDCQPYHHIWTSTTWEICDLRSWLNHDFFNTAFSREEQIRIPTVTVSADKNPDYDSDPGNDTYDKIFLLSLAEVNQYLPTEETRKCELTAYAKAQGASGSFWWLRTPGINRDCSAHIYMNGAIYSHGYDVSLDYGANRPAMWINLKP